MEDGQTGDASGHQVGVREWLLKARLPAVLGVGIAVFLPIVGAFVALEAAYGHLGEMPDGTTLGDAGIWQQTVLLALIMGYVPVSYAIGSRGALQDALDIRRLVDCTDEGFAGLFGLHTSHVCHRLVADQRVGPVPRTEHGFGAAGVVAGVVMLIATVWSDGVWSASAWDHHRVFSGALILVLFGASGHIVYVAVNTSRGFSYLDSLPMRIDPLDLEPMAPYVRTGLRTALLWLMGVGLGSGLLAFQPDDGQSAWVVLATILVVSTVGATTVFALPLLTANRRIRTAKAAELVRVRRAIEGDRKALDESSLDHEAGDLSVADLVAYRGLVEAAPEWPFKATSILRFIFYLGIPLGSWTGGALVERLLGVFLG